MRYINQLDYPHIPYITRTSMQGENYETGQKTTIRSSGCGLCAAIMAADRLLPNVEFTLEQAVELAYKSGANTSVGTNYSCFAPAFAKKFGFKLLAAMDVEDLQNCLRTGGVAVVLVRGDRNGQKGLFTRRGHYMTVIGEEPDGRLAILDPSYKEGKFDDPEYHGKVEMKNDVIVLCSPEVLEEEAKPNWTHYYLFWRR